MEIAFELVRTVIATVSRRCSNFVVDRASTHPRFRHHVINLGHSTNTTYVYLKYIGRFWIVPPKSDSSTSSGTRKEGEMKITPNVKALSDDKALEVGADTLSEIIVLSILLFLVSIGIYIRRSKANDTKRKMKESDDLINDRLNKVENDLEEIISEIKELTKALKNS